MTSRMFAIRHELKNGTVHSTRAAFEHALESETCRSNARLWIYYIRFCHANKELREKAIDVFYRAVRQCPLSKDVIMEAFTTLVKGLQGSELRATYDTMVAKGLRVHMDLEDYLEERAE